MKKLIGMIMILVVMVFMIACTTNEVADKNNNELSKNDNTVVTDNINDDASTTDMILELTLEELAKYNGKDGAKAYVAVDGDIYDMTESSFWKSGNHNGFEAGQDLTEAIKNSSPHGIKNLKRVPKIGILVEKKTDSEETIDSQETSDVEETVVEDTAIVEEDTVVEETADVEEDTVVEETADVEETTDITEPIVMVELTLEELAKYNGKNNMRAYVAVDGLIYDMTESTFWTNGDHHGYEAGQDLTEIIKNLSPHGVKNLERVVEIGILVESPMEEEEDTVQEKPYDGVLDVKEEDIGPLRLTLEELKAYTGKDGKDALIAVDGLIFDITYAAPWLDGEHNGFAAGEDHSENIHLSPHGYSKLRHIPVEGKIID